MNDLIPSSQPTALLAPAIALGFFVIGTLSLLACLGVLFLQPEVTTGHPYRVESLALGALAVFGFVGSFLFGAAYLLSPVMATVSLVGGRLAVAHLLLHALGPGWLVLVFGGRVFLSDPTALLSAGAGLLLSGALAHIVGILSTASRLNRWEPEQLTLVASLFWLGMTALLGLVVLAEPWLPAFLRNHADLLEVQAPLGLLGFLWLGLLGLALKLFNMFLVTEKSAGGLSWAGWVLVNAALMAMVPVLLRGGGIGLIPTFAALALGSLFYLADIARIWRTARRPLDWALIGSFVGLAGGLALLVWLAVELRGAFEVGGGVTGIDEMRTVFVVGVFGSFAVSMLGLSLRLIPFLVWRLRCAPLAARRPVPSPRALAVPGAGAGMMICPLSAWAYLAAGQWSGAVAGTQLAAVCLSVGLFWFLRALAPAFRLFVFGIQLREEKNGGLDAGQNAPSARMLS